eukprot:2651079-Rhodomonas_salina.1
MSVGVKTSCPTSPASKVLTNNGTTGTKTPSVLMPRTSGRLSASNPSVAIAKTWSAKKARTEAHHAESIDVQNRASFTSLLRRGVQQLATSLLISKSTDPSGPLRC